MTETPDRRSFVVPHPLIPPAAMRNHKDDQEYLASAARHIAMIDGLVSITKSSRVLDVGCAAGRLALPLLNYLDPDDGGLYEGFDIREDYILWASSHITRLYPNFGFKFIDVVNSFMNDSGTVDGSTFDFPYPDRHFDTILFHSVFTHLLPDQAWHYLAEAQRVLSAGGRIYSTWYLWDEATAESVRSNEVLWSFPVVRRDYRLMDADRPELAVAFSYDRLVQAIHDNGLQIETQTRGSWRVLPNHGQDIVILALRSQ